MKLRIFGTKDLRHRIASKLECDIHVINELYTDFLTFVRVTVDNGYEVSLKNIGTFSCIGYYKGKINSSELIDEYLKTRPYQKKFIKRFLNVLAEELRDILSEGYTVYLVGLGRLSYVKSKETDNIRLKFIPNALHLRFVKSSNLTIEDTSIDIIEPSYFDIKSSLEEGTELEI